MRVGVGSAGELFWPDAKTHSSFQARPVRRSKSENSGWPNIKPVAYRNGSLPTSTGSSWALSNKWIYRPRLPHRIVRAKKPVFQEVSLTEVPFLHSWAAKLQLPQGVTLRLNSQASAEWIGALVQKLGQIC